MNENVNLGLNEKFMKESSEKFLKLLKNLTIFEKNFIKFEKLKLFLMFVSFLIKK
jgi:hypothetical protein